MTQYYVGSKVVLAYEQEKYGKPGFGITYPDGYTSWSPREVFERAYLPIGPINSNRVTQEMVDGFVAAIEVSKLGDKTTCVRATCVNGFEITETSSCVDPANYNEQIGVENCVRRIKERLWLLLGFLLQTARYGVQHVPTSGSQAEPDAA